MFKRFAVLLVGVLLSDLSRADDWPQYLGPQRDGVYREEGVLTEFPDEGLTVNWRVPVKWGYAGPAVSGGKVFLMDYDRRQGQSKNNPGARDRLEGSERIQCFNVRDGSLVWKKEYDRPYNLSFAGGPRCTPTVDGDRVYALGAEGNLWCLDVNNGNVLWEKDFVKDYGAETAIWGVAAHPLVDGDRLYCVVGGNGSVVVAFDKRSGKEIWRALSASQPGYCAPTLIQHAGQKQLLVWHGDGVSALEPATGKSIWSVPLKPNFGMSIAPPNKTGSELFVSGYGAAALLRLNADGKNAEFVWRGSPRTAIYCGTSALFIEDGTAYGCDANTGALTAARVNDGERLWQTLKPTTGGDRRDRYGTTFLVKHRDQFFLFSETGDLILADLSPQGYEELGRFHVLEPTNQAFGRPVVWSPPAFADRCLFARNDKELVCVDLADSP